MAITKTKEVRNRSYLGKDFNSLRSSLLEYARQYYGDKINDFSEAGLGGLLLDMSAYVGDNLSYYLDHQFSELYPETVTETVNIEKMLKRSKIQISGNSPAIVDVQFYIAIPALNGSLQTDCLPIIKAGTLLESSSGIIFRLIEDIDFSELIPNTDQYVAAIKPGPLVNGQLKTFIMVRSGTCISGSEITEVFSLSGFIPFRKINLSNPHVNEIVSVTDGYGNSYYQVSSLTDDIVYTNLPNTAIDSDYVKDVITVIPAPYRYILETSLSDRTSTLTLGGGSASTFDDDAIPDPSNFAIPFKYRKTFSRISINPNQLLSTKTLGISSQDTTLSITYRYGGGLNHNVEPNSIQSISQLIITFPNNPSPSIARSIRDSVEVNNLEQAKGGADSPTIDTLKSLINSTNNSQERIVTKSDALSRIYTMPSNFGRVFRAALIQNPINPLSLQLHIISRDINSKLVTCPDTLKKNLVNYLNPYRMISDAYDILDVKVINLQIKFEVFVDPTLNKSLVLQSCINELKNYFDIQKWQIDQPINESEVIKLLQNVPGVLSTSYVWYIPRQNTYNNLEYSNIHFDVNSHKIKNFILTPQEGGSIFEIRYPDQDIIGKAV